MTVTPFQTCAVAVSILLACGSAVAGVALFRGDAHPQRAAAATIRSELAQPGAPAGAGAPIFSGRAGENGGMPSEVP